MANSDDIRLIDANRLEKEAYERFGLESIKFITLIQEQADITALPLKRANDRPFFIGYLTVIDFSVKSVYLSRI